MALLLNVLYLLLFHPATLFRRPLSLPARPAGPTAPQQPDFTQLAAHCAHVQPVPPASFVGRQDRLAQTLHALGAAAYVAEPGANAAFYANLSGAAWHLSERPLLLIVTPSSTHGLHIDSTASTDPVKANISILTPAFEATRAKLLPVPSADRIAFLEWPEDKDPYEVAASAIPGLKDGTIFVDGSMRQFVVEGLQRAVGGGVRVVGAPIEVRQLRERKSAEELEIMKCVNEVGFRAASIFCIAE
jgi:Xaa-Pro aminopeptidase